MNRSLLSSLAALAVVALLGGYAFAVEGEAKPKLHEIKGQLTKIEDKTLTITAKADAGDRVVTVTVDANTKIMVPPTEPPKEGEKPAPKEGTLADLAVGDTVAAVYNDQNVALKIMKHPAKPPRTEGKDKPKDGPKEGAPKKGVEETK